MNIVKIVEKDFDNLKEILQLKPKYILIDLELVKKYSLPINNPKNKPKKKKNLLMELEKKAALPKLNLNLKDINTKVIISFCQERPVNYRNLRKIVKAMKGYNCDIMKFEINPLNDSQNIDLVRLLVSKSASENILICVEGVYKEFWEVNSKILGNFAM